ncbi:MAG: hypothetical protein H0X71_08225 [Rubrobacter sp.]|nr:hypothetical protein [Rubrobacter sp.]
MNAAETHSRIGPIIQVGVILLALAAGIIHLYLFLIEGFLGSGAMGPVFQLLFVGNFFAYVTLAAALYLPISLLARFRPVVRVLIIAIAVAAIASYFYVNVRDTLGDVTQVIEVLLIVMVTVDAGMSNPREELAGR